MKIKFILINLFIVAYLAVSLGALTWVVTGKYLIPRPALFYFTGLMAPFRGYSTDNVEMIAEGLNSAGHWEKIDLRAYYPTGRGEYTYRTHLQTSRNRSPKLLADHYGKLKQLLKERESAKGLEYKEVKLIYHVWPKSPLGFYELYTPENITALSPLDAQ